MAENELVVREPREILSPEAVVSGATLQAKLLMDIVSKTKCYQEISGKKYLQVEAWETIGAFNRTHAETESITPLVRNEETIGYQAHVQLWKDGVVVGGAVMPCYFTENCCKGKEGDAKHKACMSAAQTFATSKAYRMNYSYIAILAGYQPTPAEEMTGDSPDDKPANLEHWCEKHQTKFFKRGRMSQYAHPIDNTSEWCNESDTKQESPPETVTSKSEGDKPDGNGIQEKENKTFGDLYTACAKEVNLKTRKEVWAELGVNSQEDISETPAECYARIATTRR